MQPLTPLLLPCVSTCLLLAECLQVLQCSPKFLIYSPYHCLPSVVLLPVLSVHSLMRKAYKDHSIKSDLTGITGL